MTDIDIYIDGSPIRVDVSAAQGPGGGAAPSWGDVMGKPSEFPPSDHTHTLSEITDAGTAAAAALIDDDTMATASAANVPSAESVKAYVDANSGVWDGDITDINLDGGADIGADLADADLILVDDGATGTNRKSALSRVWTYIKAKIEATALTFTEHLTATAQGTGTADNSLMTRALSDARYFVPVVKTSTNEESANSFTLADVIGLTGYSLEASKVYRFEFYGYATCTTTGGGIRLGMILSNGFEAINTDSSTYQTGWAQFGSMANPTASWVVGTTGYALVNRAAATLNKQPLYCVAYFKTNANAQTMKIQLSNNNTAGTITLHAGAVGVLTKLS